MKYGLIAGAAMALAGTLSAQSNIPVATPNPFGNMTPTNAHGGEQTIVPDNGRYIDRPELLLGVQARLTAMTGKPCNIIFIGDSITEYWSTTGRAVWEKNYTPQHAFNFGLQGDTTQNVLWRLTNMDVQDLKPKVAVILIGTNNTSDDPHTIADGVRAVISNTEEIFAGVKIILVSILPNVRANEKMMQANALIRNFADNDTVYYLDLAPLMPIESTTQPDGTVLSRYKGIGTDGLHPDANGYEIWADAMAPLLKKLLGN